ncbi:cation:proton antiporter regulatory subunit [Ammonifex thiophilus]|uniref:Potassium transporter TrkA n=1 Tax=Ammonifex thiophilus TaxID=444093 RepID=A0A3D8P483_9THEO|nr:TrkA C-terminal domain-containing protein [Ammonifex thiophilus]RDV83935.1 potassium transporter TrkA [Ammonifex thiophilus]
MAIIKEAELPGLGKKYSVALESGDRLDIIIYDEGEREIFFFPPGEEEPLCSATLTDQEARQVGSIIGGAFYQPRLLEKLEAAIAELFIEWIKVKPGSSLVGKSIGELGLRKNFGITVIGVVEEGERGKKKTVAINPGPSFTFSPGQIVIVAGRRDAVEHFESLAGR